MLKKKQTNKQHRGCLVCVLKQQFSVFKQHFTYFNIFFYPHVFSQIFLNNNFQFLNTYTKRAHKHYACMIHFNKVSTLKTQLKETQKNK